MRRTFAILVLLVLLAAAAGGYAWMRIRHLDQFARAPYGSGDKVVLIPPRSGPHALAALLVHEGLTSSADDFYDWLRWHKLAPKLRAGEYEFSGAVSPEQIVDKLISGQQKVYHFTVPEGLRQDEILPILAQSELHLSLPRLEALAKDTAFIHKLGVPADSLEGFLFPDTYSFTHGYTEQSVLTKMVSRTLEEYRKADERRKPGVRLNLLQTLTLASIVEKETGPADDRAHISCVFHNRLKRNMKLQTDPTVLYAMMLLRGKFIKNITAQDLVTDQPYNTYTRYGLPPGPIANPGEAALVATLDPSECPDLYFVSRNDGSSVFCPDLKCHNAAVNRWQVEYYRHPHPLRTVSNTRRLRR